MEAQEYAAHLDSLEKKLDRLRALYEQYFQGFEKIIPQVQRKEVDRLIYQIRRERVANTALRFRFQTVIQRYTTLSAYWQRICREIEEGTYFRHVLKAEKLKVLLDREEGAAQALRGQGSAVHRIDTDSELDLEVDIDGSDAEEGSAPDPAFAQARSLDDLRRLLAEAGPDDAPPPTSRRRLPPPPPGAARRIAAAHAGAPAAPPVAGSAVAPSRPAAPAAGGSGASLRPAPSRPAAPAASPSAEGSAPATAAPVLPADRVASLYAEFAAAARRGGGTSVPSVGALRSSLEKEAQRLARKHPGRRIEFRVDVREGKPIIKSLVVTSKDA